MEKVADVIIALHHPTLEADPSIQPIALAFGLAVLEAGRLQQLHAPRAGQTDGHFRATRAVFETAVETAPGSFAERWRGPGDGVELAACEAHVRNGGCGEVGSYLGYHLDRKAEEGCGGHLKMFSSVRLAKLKGWTLCLVCCVGLLSSEALSDLGGGRDRRCVGWRNVDGGQTEKMYSLARSQQYSLSCVDSPVRFTSSIHRFDLNHLSSFTVLV